MEKFFRNGQLRGNAALAAMLLREIFCAKSQIKFCNILYVSKKAWKRSANWFMVFLKTERNFEQLIARVAEAGGMVSF